ncbi:prepilin-type N-terminal cleavage/methylation domain-containing protein [Cohnella sp. JJ-181]|uniref:prepilin-type N-terminal cleavage/methylation domain-containing protein n=1 Tax=Cohnella rhizoplanae TaxID=2974897 RepID=UPI0022FF6905|nr:prepilin-type N-terminal cleavage/methylation domain-containing protein [Cohnella sp. JJ-181]CAI6040870.1 hypothetical protein COHCIP112018_01082 [Cohnella sp. JJ-181]
MRKYAKRLLHEERGLTLVELIATVSVFSIVMLAIYGIIHFGLGTYHRITIENSLRDEGDLLMSSVITELYDFAPESVSQSIDGLKLSKKAAEIGGNEDYIELKDRAMYISGDKLEIRSDVLDSSSIAVTCTASDEASACTAGLIEINLELSQTYDGRDQRLKLQSRFGF